MQYLIQVANKSHFKYAQSICIMMEKAAQVRGTGIARRDPDYIMQKMREHKAIIALDDDKVIGFCYIESWEDEKYVANSGLIIHPAYRKQGLAKALKKETFVLSAKMFPKSKLFGITTSMAVMKINSELGYKPVTFSELTQDEKFWNGCQSCTNYDILLRTQKQMCICTGMVYDFNSTPNDLINKNTAWNKFKEFMQVRKKRILELTKQLPTIQKLYQNEK